MPWGCRLRRPFEAGGRGGRRRAPLMRAENPAAQPLQIASDQDHVQDGTAVECTIRARVMGVLAYLRWSFFVLRLSPGRYHKSERARTSEPPPRCCIRR
mmetsp:Transcript_45768/g.146911  ORF Transcript_45768/g.146911 Transcript_45768/m.146911 type:complete len:99 (+) Transcript_45768:2980-3276(+)